MIHCGNCNNNFESYLQFIIHDNCDSIFIDKNIDLSFIKEFSNYLDYFPMKEKYECNWYCNDDELTFEFSDDCQKIFETIYKNYIPEPTGIYKLFSQYYYYNYKCTDTITKILQYLYLTHNSKSYFIIGNYDNLLSKQYKIKYYKEIVICLLDKYFNLDINLKVDTNHKINELEKKINILEEKLKIK